MAVVLLALAFGVFTVVAETVFHVPLKLPGHRVLPGALALLMFAEAFAPLALIGFAAAVSSVLVMSGESPAIVIAVWVVASLGIWAVGRSRIAGRFLYFLIGGVLFGGLMFMSKMMGPHHTPNLIRAAGHLGFGALGGIVSFGASKVLGSGKQS